MTALLIAMAIAVVVAGAAAGEEAFVAGVEPDKRPAGVPVVTEFEKSGEWYERALVGVSAPYPASLRFLEDQARWYTPFNHPGMTGPYDIRNWHGDR